MTADDIDLVEINEAFAPVPMITMQEIGIPHDKVNVNGGAIALGHPLGATGAMLIGTLIDELERQDKTIGLATMCIGLGMGIATIVERVLIGAARRGRAEAPASSSRATTRTSGPRRSALRRRPRPRVCLATRRRARADGAAAGRLGRL